MGNTKSFIIFILFSLFVCLIAAPAMAGGQGVKAATSQKKVIPGGDIVNLSGSILDTHNRTH